jgi:hypothetical protein
MNRISLYIKFHTVLATSLLYQWKFSQTRAWVQVKKIRNIRIKINTTPKPNSKVHHFSTQPNHFSIHVVHHCTSLCTSLHKNVSDQSNKPPMSCILQLMVTDKMMPPKESWRCSNTRKSHGTSSDLHGGWHKHLLESFNVAGSHWHATNRCHFTAVLAVCSSGCQAASHCTGHCLQSYSFPDDAEGLVSTNPRTVWAQLFQLLVEISTLFDKGCHVFPFHILTFAFWLVVVAPCFIPWQCDSERCHFPHDKKKTLRGFGPLANYADRATAASWRSSTNFCG